jgi:hypothetical protein
MGWEEVEEMKEEGKVLGCILLPIIVLRVLHSLQIFYNSMPDVCPKFTLRTSMVRI